MPTKDRLYNKDSQSDKQWRREVHQKAKGLIEETLPTVASGLTFSAICGAMVYRFDTLCDNTIKDKSGGNYPAWKWEITYVLQELKKQGKVECKNGKIWIWASGTEQPSTPQPLKRHEELKQKLVEIGKYLGYHTSTEEGPVYRHDVLWKRSSYRKDPCHVIEICSGGSLPKDFDSLNWARENLAAIGILVTVDEADYQKAVQRFGNQAQIVVAKAETVDRLHGLITTNLEFLRVIFREHF